MLEERTKTPFDRSEAERPLVRALVHTPSLEDSIRNQEESAIKLIDLGSFEYIETIFLPPGDSQIRNLLQSKGVTICDLDCQDKTLILSYSGSKKSSAKSKYSMEAIVGYCFGKDPEQEVCSSSRVKWKELIAGRNHRDSKQNPFGLFDYFVVGENDPFMSSQLRTNREVTPTELLELVRILCAGLGIFEIRPHFYVDEGFYYLYRFKKIFHSYQKAWTIVCEANGKSIPEEVFYQFQSLSIRLEFICRAVDKVSFFALKSPNNNTLYNASYHLAFLILLITGCFDDLAWIAKHLYCLNLDKHDIEIKIPIKEQRSKFTKKLREHNQSLADFLENDDTKIKINLFNHIRDSIMHREFLTGATCQVHDSGTTKSFITIYPPNEFLDLFKCSGYSFDAWGLVTLGNEIHIEPYLFCTQALFHCAQVVNTFLGLIVWDDYIGEFSEEQLKRISERIALYESSLATFLNWSAEPIYF